MKAAYLTELRKVALSDAPVPQIVNDDDVLIKVAAVGVCGSDMHYHRTGRIGLQVVQYPWVVGHECAGTVEQVGQAVEGLSVGDRVAVDPLLRCGKCDQCLSHREHTCRNQTFMGNPGQTTGALAEYVVMPAKSCFRIPDDMTMTRAVMVEPLSVGMYAANVLTGGAAGKTAAIFGSGPIGLCVLMALKQAGAGFVAATDIHDWRRELAAECGADWTGNPLKEDVVAGVAASQPGGVDVAFECAGEQETVDQCAEVLKPGGLMLLVGIAETDRISFNMNVARRKELRICNVRRQNECVQPALDAIHTGEINVDPLVTHNFTLAETQKAFDLVADYKDNVVKAIIHIAE